jgi:spermidine/putrescine transport system substrate-binding protein
VEDFAGFGLGRRCGDRCEIRQQARRGYATSAIMRTFPSVPRSRTVLPTNRFPLRLGLLWAALITLALPLCAEDTGAAPEPATPVQELVFFTWADFIDPGVVADFEREYGVRVREVHFENDEVRDRVMAETGGAGFDLLLVDGTGVEAYRRRGWIAPIDAATAPNLAHIAPRWLPAGAAGRAAAVPYVWGTLGIAYRRDLLGRELDSWMDLLRPEPDLAGRILMSSDSLDLVGMVLKALGHSMNSTDPQALAAARDLLLEQAPAVHRYGALAVDEGSELLGPDVVAGMTFNGDAAALMEHNTSVVYVVPREGGALWVDFLAVAAASEQKALATAFIDYLNRPEVAARNAQGIYYATPNRAAEALLPAAFRADPLVYPDADTLARCEPYRRLTPEAQRTRAQIVSQVVDGG